jgi:hypothetical protein
MWLITKEKCLRIVLKAQAGTVESIKEHLSNTGWFLTYRLSAPSWKADKVVVKCCIHIPPKHTELVSQILSAVESLIKESESDCHSESSIVLNKGSEEGVSDDENGEGEEEEGNKEGGDVCDSWDSE